MNNLGKQIRVIHGNTELLCYFYGIDYREYNAGIEYELHAAYSKRGNYRWDSSEKSHRDIYWALYKDEELADFVKDAESGDTVYIDFISSRKSDSYNGTYWLEDTRDRWEMELERRKTEK